VTLSPACTTSSPASPSTITIGLRWHPTASVALLPYSNSLSSCCCRQNRVKSLPLHWNFQPRSSICSKMELVEDGDGVECLHLAKLGGAKIEASPQNPDHDFSAATSLACDRRPRFKENLCPSRPFIHYRPNCSPVNLLTALAIAQDCQPTFSSPSCSKF
jgi:hypothetical protein